LCLIFFIHQNLKKTLKTFKPRFFSALILTEMGGKDGRIFIGVETDEDEDVRRVAAADAAA